MTDIQSSVLFTEKSMLGIDIDDTAFDQELIVYINSALFTLFQLGIGEYANPPMILGTEDPWEIVIGDRLDLESVKSYIYLKVKTIFDPPSNAFVMTSMENQIKELEWRLNVQAESEETHE